MKKLNKIVLSLLVALAATFTFVGCYEPSPLYGTWQDDYSKISFFPDGKFEASINSDSGLYECTGTYEVIDNVICFSILEPSASQSISEWDIRGSILYLYFRNDNNEEVYTVLYHTARG